MQAVNIKSGAKTNQEECFGGSGEMEENLGSFSMKGKENTRRHQ